MMSADRRKNKNTTVPITCNRSHNKVITVIANRKKLEVGDILNEIEQNKARHGKLNDKNIKLRHVKIYLNVSCALRMWLE